jgi:hypothetical protein
VCPISALVGATDGHNLIKRQYLIALERTERASFAASVVWSQTERLPRVRRAEQTLARFLSTLDLPISELNRAEPGPFGANHPPALPTLALWCLADLAFRLSTLELAILAEKRGVDFSKNALAQLKVQITPLPEPERLRTVIAALAASMFSGDEADGLYRLVAARGGKRLVEELLKNKSRLTPATKTALERVHRAIVVIERES